MSLIQPKPQFTEMTFSDVKIRCFEDARLGMIPAPLNVPQLWAVLKHLPKQLTPRIWRGMADIDWPVDSGVVREHKLIKRYFERITNENGIDSGILGFEMETSVKNTEEEVLNRMRGQGWNVRNGVRLSEAQMFAVLQHHGAATRFIDFTSNIFIALWFAVALNEEYLNKCGYIVGLNTAHSSVMQLKDSELLVGRINGVEVEGKFEEVIDRYPNKEIFTWTPTFLYERMRIQQSVLVFSRIHEGQWSSLSPKEFSDISNQKRFNAIAISPKFKKELSRDIGGLLGYNSSVMFPDLDGFSRHHSAQSSVRFWDALDVLNTPDEDMW